MCRWVKYVKEIWPQAGTQLEERGAVSGSCGHACYCPTLDRRSSPGSYLEGGPRRCSRPMVCPACRPGPEVTLVSVELRTVLGRKASGSCLAHGGRSKFLYLQFLPESHKRCHWTDF